MIAIIIIILRLVVVVEVVVVVVVVAVAVVVVVVVVVVCSANALHRSSLRYTLAGPIRPLPYDASMEAGDANRGLHFSRYVRVILAQGPC